MRPHILLTLLLPGTLLGCFDRHPDSGDPDTGAGTDGTGSDTGVAVESCDGVDNNGDGNIDEGFDGDGDGVADCFEVCGTTLGFELDALGNAVVAGQDVSSIYAQAGVEITAYNSQNRSTTGWAIAFDSANPTGGDTDLGTPHQDYGGPGVGTGGRLTNDVARGNLLISDGTGRDADGDGIVDVPNDDARGGWLHFNFADGVCVHSLTFIDIDENNPVDVTFVDSASNQTTVDVQGAGDNSVVVESFSACDVVDLWVNLPGSGAVDDLVFCPDADEEICDGLDNDGDGLIDEDTDDTDGDGTCDDLDTEECDGLDNNGDGAVDEGFSDTDGDGTADCVDSEDCDGVDNDGDGAVDEDFPDTDSDGIADCLDVEECDGLDNDGDGATDEGFNDTDVDGIADCVDTEGCDGFDNDGDGDIDEGYADTDGDGTADCIDTETCDGLDNDGDGMVDEGFSDTDGDGIADCIDVEECDGLDNDGDGDVDEDMPDADADGTCDALDSEDCDGLDNDGDGLIDEDFDADGDGYTTCGIEGEADCDLLFDLGHGEDTWSDPYDYTTSHGWGYAADDVLDLGYGWDSTTQTLTSSVLGAYDAVVIAEPVSSFSASEITALLDFVDAGGGLLLITDHNESTINSIGQYFGVEWLGRSASIGWTRVNTWDTGHPTTDGIGSVFSPLGSVMSVTSTDVEVWGESGGNPFYATLEYGDGRVVFASDNEIFAAYSYFGTGDSSTLARDNEQLWSQTVDWLVDCTEGVPADCDDTDASVYPGATEDCDGVDDDCDGDVDEGTSDTDGDGTCDNLDTEVCDGLDNDGDGSVDEGFDSDGDGFADCMEECEATLTFCSAEDGFNVLSNGSNAVTTYSANPRWTASISGASWIWDERLETDPESDEVHSIFREFKLQSSATDISATLEIGADNSYEVWLNGTSVGSDATEYNYFAPTDTWDVSSAVAAGDNEFEFEVWNWAQCGGNAYSNPGGLLYCVEIDYTYEMDAESCNGVDDDCDGVVDEGCP